MKYGDVGIGEGQSVLVDDSARQVAVGLVGTLNENLLTLRTALVYNHVDGIEAYHLLDGFGQRLATDGGGDAEIFELVVEEHDRKVVLLLVQLAKGIRERHIIEGACDTLGLHRCKEQASDEDSNSTFHSLLLYDDLLMIQHDVQTLEMVEVVNHLLYTLFTMPDEIETQLASLFVAEDHL